MENSEHIIIDNIVSVELIDEKFYELEERVRTYNQEKVVGKTLWGHDIIEPYTTEEVHYYPIQINRKEVIGTSYVYAPVCLTKDSLEKMKGNSNVVDNELKYDGEKCFNYPYARIRLTEEGVPRYIIKSFIDYDEMTDFINNLLEQSTKKFTLL